MLQANSAKHTATFYSKIALFPSSKEASLSHRYERLQENLIAFGVDSIAFGVGLNFISSSTVLPAFAAQLGMSDALIGLLITVFFLSWDLPQLIAGNVVARVPRKKPMLMKAAAIGRPAILLFAIFLFLSGGKPAWLTIALLFSVLATLFSTDAFAAIAWFDLLGRAFPPEKRRTYLAIWQVIKAVGVLGVFFLVQYVLGEKGPEFPYNFAILFLAASIALLISGAALIFIHEVPHGDSEPATTQIAWSDFRKHLVIVWRQDRSMREANTARILIVFGTMATGFYVIFATEVAQLPVEVIARFILAQTIGNLLGSIFFGRIADRSGSLRVIQLGALILLTAPLIALALALFSGLPASLVIALLLAVYVIVGACDNIIILGFMNYVLDIAPPGQRTIYMGVSNALNGLGVLGPLFAGWLLGLTSYSMLFSVAIVFAAVGMIFAMRLPAMRTSLEPAQDQKTQVP
jgi:MFS family permease